MANRDVGEHFPKVRGRRQAPSLLRVEHVARHGVLTDISLLAAAGEVLGIGGLLGAGRTELARVLAGADRADAGRIVVDGQAVALRRPADAIATASGCCPKIARRRVWSPA